ncbi:hypothetical protein ACWGOK_36070 [Streptomyces eurythermus]
MAMYGDDYLLALEQLVEQDAGNHIPVTVWLPGGLMFADLVSGQAWRKAWADESQVFSSGAGVEALAYLPEALEEARAAADDGATVDGFLHFRDADLHTGGVVTRVSLWRCRLTDVAGWTLGRPE